MVDTRHFPERCAHESIALTRVSIDPELGAELGLIEGKVLAHGDRPTVHCEPRLGRRVRFERGSTADRLI